MCRQITTVSAQQECRLNPLKELLVAKVFPIRQFDFSNDHMSREKVQDSVFAIHKSHKLERRSIKNC